MDGRVEKAFQEWIAAVYPGVVLRGTQMAECRNAFFAGVHWMQVKLPDSLDIGDDPTDADLAVMTEIDDEICNHIAGLIPTSGRA